jgi:peroxin-5
MSFLGGPECSTAGNPLTQFTKHVQNDTSLQRDRLVGRGPGGFEESMRTRMAPNGSDQVRTDIPRRTVNLLTGQMMNDFMQQSASPQPFAMDQLRQDLPHAQSLTRRTPSPGWSAEFDPGQQARMEAAFANSQAAPQRHHNFSAAEFSRFQHSGSSSTQQSSTPIPQGQAYAPSFQSPMGMGYMNGGMGMGMGMGMGYNSMPMQQQPQPDVTTGKGKERMVELDDKNWEEQFAQLDQDNISEQANQAMERELEEVDRSVNSNADDFADLEYIWQRTSAEHAPRQMTEDPEFDTVFSNEDLAAWENFDSTLGMGNNSAWERQPMLGDYMFESNNPFLENTNPAKSAFEQGLEILQSHGNLSLAALAFEAAVQTAPNHVEAWTHLGSAQAQNEKESPAIRALEKAIQ